MLQWGHRLSPVETYVCALWQGLPIKLQWGHRLSPVETLSGSPGVECFSSASMGPPAFAGGNIPDHAVFRPRKVLQCLHRARWGHRLSPVETAICVWTRTAGNVQAQFSPCIFRNPYSLFAVPRTFSISLWRNCERCKGRPSLLGLSQGAFAPFACYTITTALRGSSRALPKTV